MGQLRMITQNLNRNFYHKYMCQYQADIYAFQESKTGRSAITEIRNKESQDYIIEYNGNDRVHELSLEYFPWWEFRSGYWMEEHILYQNKKIILINIHISPYYSTFLRFLLLKRLEDLEKKNVILLGDFNAAFDYQSENSVPENHAYLDYLTKTYDYVELCSKEENVRAHYTYFDQKNNHWKKLDHIFVSKTLFEQLKEYQITYIDEVCQNSIHTDHSGIQLTFRI